MPRNIETFEADLARVNELTENSPEDFEEFTRYVDKTLTEAALAKSDIFMPLFSRFAREYIDRIDDYIETGKAEVMDQVGIYDRLDAITEDYFEQDLSFEDFLDKFDREHPNEHPCFMPVLAEHLAIAIEVDEEGPLEEDPAWD